MGGWFCIVAIGTKIMVNAGSCPLLGRCSLLGCPLIEVPLYNPLDNCFMVCLVY